MAIIIKRF